MNEPSEHQPRSPADREAPTVECGERRCSCNSRTGSRRRCGFGFRLARPPGSRADARSLTPSCRSLDGHLNRRRRRLPAPSCARSAQADVLAAELVRRAVVARTRFARAEVARGLSVLRAARAARGARLVRVVASLNRGMRALSRSMGRRGFGYVVALTPLVTVAEAAGMYAFEDELPGGGGLAGYATALWWTAMVMTTLGSDWPSPRRARPVFPARALRVCGLGIHHRLARHVLPGTRRR
jgi:hypothetical protein